VFTDCRNKYSLITSTEAKVVYDFHIVDRWLRELSLWVGRCSSLW